MDAFGVATDVVALALPGVPGGASVAIKSSRAARAGHKIVKGMRYVDQGINMYQAGAGAVRAYDDFREGRIVSGLLNSTGMALQGLHFGVRLKAMAKARRLQAGAAANSATRQRVLANIAESRAARRVTSFREHAATDSLRGLTRAANQRLGAHPGLARSVLTGAEYAAGQRSPAVGRMFYGHAVERLVAQDIAVSPTLSGLFRYVGGARNPDFVGIGRYAGLDFDMTTNTARQVLAHRARAYSPALVLYDRPADFVRFP
jgi:hypothetical protein